jgi:lipoprotein-releasing system permease protein
MLSVALLNMTTSLLMIVMERQRMIGQSRALGMRRGSVIRLFLFRALFILGKALEAYPGRIDK